MKLNLSSVEEYDKLSDDEVRLEILKVQHDLSQVPHKMDSDIHLQKAMRVVESLKAPYHSERQRLKSVLATLNIIGRSRSIL